MNRPIFASALCLALACGVAPARSAGADAARAKAASWRVQQHVDKMSGTSSISAVIERTADDGSHFEVTAQCTTLGDIKTMTMSFLLTDQNARYQIGETTNVSGSDLFGYSANTRRQTAIRFKFDSGDPVGMAPDIDYTNQFSLLFPEMDKVRAESQNPEGSGRDSESGMAGAMKALGGLTAMLSGAADVSDLANASTMAIQVNLSGGSTPYLEVPLTSVFKTYVARCRGVAAANSSTGADTLPTDVIEDQVRGAYETADHADRYVFGDGIVKHFKNGQEQPDFAYSLSGQVIVLKLPNGAKLAVILNTDGQLVPTDPAFGRTVVATRVR